MESKILEIDIESSTEIGILVEIDGTKYRGIVERQEE